MYGKGAIFAVRQAQAWMPERANRRMDAPLSEEQCECSAFPGGFHHALTNDLYTMP